MLYLGAIGWKEMTSLFQDKVKDVSSVGSSMHLLLVWARQFIQFTDYTSDSLLFLLSIFSS